MRYYFKFFLIVLSMLLAGNMKAQSSCQSTWEVPVSVIDVNTHVYFVVTNSSDSVISFLRPDAGKMNCFIKGPDNNRSQVSIKNGNRKAMWDDTLYHVPHKIYLQPGCTVKIDLGILIPGANKLPDTYKGENTILVLNYKSDIRDGYSRVQTEQIPDGSSMEVSIDTDKNVIRAGSPVFLNVTLKNSGNEVLEMKNEFFPYDESRFHFIIRYRKDAVAEETIIAPGNPYSSLSDNNALSGQFVLLPNEYLSVRFNVTKYLAEKGIYEIQLIYSDRLKVGKKKAPEYLKQFKWETNKIVLNVI